MKTIFKVGMTVYDQVVFPDKEGQVINIVEKDAFPIKVYLEGIGVTHSYTKDGRVIEKISPTLSTSSYTLQGFEQKAPVLTENDKIERERNYSYRRVLAFKTSEIRYKFFEEQKELLEIAKPLL